MAVRSRVRSLCWLRPVGACALVALLLQAGVVPAVADLGDCGQPASAGQSPVASDALFTLRAAVGTQTCQLCVCDLNNDGSLTASDALINLAAAVGQPIPLNCPPCGGQSCEESQTPTCGGSCAEGLTCAPDAEDDGECSCQNDCQLGPAPTCGGSCESDEPGSVCTSIRIAPTGRDPIEVCECLPPDLTFCEDAEAPACEGVCTPNSVCSSDGDSGCVCSSLPAQPECTQAEAPGCLGTCADTPEGSTICESNGEGACICVPFTGQTETCFDAEAPMCGGVCAFGDMCAVDVEGCECVSPCEIGNAPSCGGTCTDEGESCVVTTFTVRGTSKDFCECWVITQ